MWEPCGNMKKAYWSKYSKSASYDTPWLLANGWENGSSSEVFTLDTLEESHSGASFGHQDYQEAAAVTSHNFTEVEESTMAAGTTKPLFPFDKQSEHAKHLGILQRPCIN
ncbi:unnamed protein product [Prunus brigantina]